MTILNFQMHLLVTKIHSVNPTDWLWCITKQVPVSTSQSFKLNEWKGSTHKSFDNTFQYSDFNIVANLNSAVCHKVRRLINRICLTTHLLTRAPFTRKVSYIRIKCTLAALTRLCWLDHKSKSNASWFSQLYVYEASSSREGGSNASEDVW